MKEKTSCQKTENYEYTANGVRLSMASGQILFKENAQNRPSEITFHTHAWYELFFVTRGTLFLHFKDESVVLAQGDLMLIAPDTWHYSSSAVSGSMQSVFNFSVQYLQKSEAAKQISDLLDFPQYRSFHANETVASLIGFLSDAVDKKAELLVGSHLMGMLLEASAAVFSPDEHSAPPAVDHKLGRLYKIEQALFRYYTKELPLESIAEELHLSPRQLSRIIKKQYGMTYRAKNKELRMKRAAELLSCGESVAQTANKVGYASISSFYSSFLSYYGVSPAAYRTSGEAEQDS